MKLYERIVALYRDPEHGYLCADNCSHCACLSITSTATYSRYQPVPNWRSASPASKGIASLALTPLFLNRMMHRGGSVDQVAGGFAFARRALTLFG